MKARGDRNSKLMIAMGSKTGKWDPHPPDQRAARMNHADSQVERAVAWTESFTTTRNSPFAVNEHGRPLYVEDMARDLGWELQTARNILSEACRTGRLRTDETGNGGSSRRHRIWYCAFVPGAYDRRKEGEENNFVQSCQPSYLVDFIENLPEHRRAAFLARYEAFSSWSKSFFSEAVAAARGVIERYEDTILAAEGVEKKRLPKRREAGNGNGHSQLKLELLAEPDFVQSCEVGVCTESEIGSVQNGNGDVQSPASLLLQTPDTRHATASVDDPGEAAKAAAANDTLPAEDEAREVRDAMRPYASLVTKAAARRIAAACRRHFPDATTAEIVEEVHRRGARILRGGIDDPVSFLVRVVPERFEGYERPAPVPEPAPVEVCVSCSGTGLRGVPPADGTIAAAREALQQGATICECDDGRWLRDMLGEHGQAAGGEA